MNEAAQYETSPEDPDEMAMAVAYGKAGFKKCTQTKEYDEWLDTFEVIKDDFERMEHVGEGSFLTNNQVSVPESKRNKILEKLSKLVEAAEEINSKDLEERNQMDVDHLVELSDDLRQEISDLK